MANPISMANAKEYITESPPLYKEDLLEHAPTHGTYLDKDEVSHLSQEHRQYLIERHGTFDLDPLPTMGTVKTPMYELYVIHTLTSYTNILGRSIQLASVEGRLYNILLVFPY
jgi:hypothetical protein